MTRISVPGFGNLESLMKSLVIRPPIASLIVPNPAIGAAVQSISRSWTLPKSIAAVFREEAARLHRYEPKARLLGESGWTLPMRLSAAALPDILEGIEAGVVYDDEFEELYTHNDHRLLKEIAADVESGKQFGPWRPLLMECLDAYHREHFQVTVPALLVVLEGMIADATATVLTSKDPKGPAAKQRARSTRGFERLIWASIEGFTTELYRNVGFSQPRPRLTNRHWVQHGRDLEGWKRVDVLRLFNAVDTVSCEVRSPGRREVS